MVVLRPEAFENMAERVGFYCLRFQQVAVIPTDSDYSQCLRTFKARRRFGGLPAAVAADAGIRRKTVSLVSPSVEGKFLTPERKNLAHVTPVTRLYNSDLHWVTMAPRLHCMYTLRKTRQAADSNLSTRHDRRRKCTACRKDAPDGPCNERRPSERLSVAAGLIRNYRTRLRAGAELPIG